MSLEMQQAQSLNRPKPQETQQIKEILAEARSIKIKPEDRNAKGELLARPGGEVSRLSEEDWKIVRTKKFKEWFGDWESPKVKSFITSKDSVYTYDAEGRTSRFKKATNEQHEAQDVTVFLELTPEEENRILDAYRRERNPAGRGKIYVMEKLADGSPKRITKMSEITDPGRIYLTIYQNDQMVWAKPAEVKPRIGLSAFDTKQGVDEDGEYTERHLGNAIKEIVHDCSKVRDDHGEPQVLKNSDGTRSFIKMQRPFDVKEGEVDDFFKKNGILNKPDRYQILMKALEAQGFDGLTLNGKPVRFKDGSYSFNEKSQMIKI
jgi:hypothetical protein